MEVVTQGVKVELNNDEQTALLKASYVLEEFLENMRNNHYLSARFEGYGYKYSISEIQKAFEIIDILSDENPIIE